MKGIVEAEEGLCLKTQRVNCAQFHHLKRTCLRFLLSTREKLGGDVVLFGASRHQLPELA